jgi:hypothetical protein
MRDRFPSGAAGPGAVLSGAFHDGTQILRCPVEKEAFQPFRVYLSDGASYGVTHPEAAEVSGGALAILLSVTGILGPTVERRILISFIHTTRDEVFLFGEAQAS